MAKASVDDSRCLHGCILRKHRAIGVCILLKCQNIFVQRFFLNTEGTESSSLDVDSFVYCIYEISKSLKIKAKLGVLQRR